MIVLSIAVIALVTYLLRLAPFIIFAKHQKAPEWILYIGKYLPPAVMGMLIIYSLKNTDIFQITQSGPIAIAIFITVMLHLWRRNNLLSILSGTLVYMLLVQVVFM